MPWELPKHLAAKAARKHLEAEVRRSQDRRPGAPPRSSSVLKPTNSSRPAGVGGGVIGARVAAAAEYENRLKQQLASGPTGGKSRILAMGEQAVLSRLQQKAAKEGGVGGKAIGASATRGPSKASSKAMPRKAPVERDDLEDAWDQLGR
eukprot:Tamp_14567.p2 GENE.Tamp_14567~~Tamp_14567.p2  ORF type:complete len:149 (-),score=19.74 Tamp_14567:862-1308(-)